MTSIKNISFPRYIAVIAILFGIITVVAGGSVALGVSPAQQAAGSVVGFVVWFNFLAGFVYILAGFGLWHGKPWAIGLAAGIALATVAVLGLFLWHVQTGGAYEARTGFALGFRALVWVALALVARKSLKNARTG